MKKQSFVMMVIIGLLTGGCSSQSSSIQNTGASERETAKAGAQPAAQNAATAAEIAQVEFYPQMGIEGRNPDVHFSPDGKWIYSTKGIWDAATGRELKRRYNTSIIGFSPDMKRYLRGTGSVVRVADWETDTVSVTIEGIQGVQVQARTIFSPDGKQVAAVTGDKNNIKVWDSSNGQELMTIYGSGAGIGRFCYTADGKNIIYREIISSNNKVSSWPVKIYDLADRRQLRSFPVEYTERSQEDIFSPDGKMYIVASTTGEIGNYRGLIKLYDTETGRELRTLTGHNSFITGLAGSHDGRNIISVDRDNVMKIWNAATGREVHSAKLNSDDYITELAYSADNKRIVYSSDSRIVVMDAGTYRELTAIINLPGVREITYIDEKQAIVQIDEAINLWNMETGRRSGSIQGSLRANLSPDKRFIAKTELDFNSKQEVIEIIGIYETTTGRLIRSWTNRLNYFTTKIIWSQDGREINTVDAVLGNPNLRSFGRWNVENGQHISGFQHNPVPLSAKNMREPYVYPNSDVSRVAYRFDDSLQIYETRGTRKLFTINGYFSYVHWSPEGQRIYGSSDETVRIWDAQTGKEISSSIKHGRLYRVVYSSDGRRIITCSQDDGTVKVWDAQTGREIPSSIKQGDLSALEYSPDNRQFATGGSNQWVQAWNAENGTKLWQKAIGNAVESLTYNEDGKRIIVKTPVSITVLDAANGNSLFENFQNPATAVCSPDGKWIITGHEDSSVRVWSAETSVEKIRLVAYEDGEWIAMTPDGYYAASAKGEQYLNARIGNSVTGIDRYRSVFNKPEAVQARLSNSGRMEHRNAITSVAVHPGGGRLASVSLDGSIKLWDTESGKETRTITGIGGSVNTITFSPDGKRLIHGAEDKSIRIWDAETGRVVSTINGHTEYVNEARYSPDGKQIVSCADDKLIKIWDAETGKEIRTLSGHTDMVVTAVWSPDGKRIASGSEGTEKTIRIWDAESGQVIKTIPDQGGRVRGLAFSPDGKRLASCTGEEQAVKVWEAANGELLRSIAIEDANPGSLTWSPDGKRIAVGSSNESNGYVELFDADTGTGITFWVGGYPASLAYTTDGRRIAVVRNFSDAKVISLYDVSSRKEL